MAAGRDHRWTPLAKAYHELALQATSGHLSLTHEFARGYGIPTMAMTDEWHRLGDPEAMRAIPNRAGVYQLADSNKIVIYIGRAKGGNLRARLRTHANERVNDCIHKTAVYFRYIVTRAHRREEKTAFVEYKAEHNGEIPLCNTIDPSLRR